MSLVLWSGGADSTLVLYDLLLEQASKCDSCRGKLDVRTIAINHNNVGGIVESKAARERIMAFLKKEKGWTFIHTELNITRDGGVDIHGSENGEGLTQPLMWMHAILHLREKEDLYFGYIRGDDVWHYLEYLKYAFSNLQRIRHGSGTMLAPLEWESKAKVISRLQQIGLADKVWYCEDSTSMRTNKAIKTPCGECNSCKTHKLGEITADLVKQEGDELCRGVPGLLKDLKPARQCKSSRLATPCIPALGTSNFVQSPRSRKKPNSK